jgi:shikimate dehydrogenase
LRARGIEVLEVERPKHRRSSRSNVEKSDPSDAERAAHLRDELHGTGMKGLVVHHFDALPDVEIVINATPLGMKEGDPMPVPSAYVREGRAFCDAVYRPGTETPLVRLARERGVPVVAGDRMLLYQGVLAQKLWTGREPNVKAMDSAIS